MKFFSVIVLGALLASAVAGPARDMDEEFLQYLIAKMANGTDQKQARIEQEDPQPAEFIKVFRLDMSDPSEICPADLEETTANERRQCRRPTGSVTGPSCASIPIPVNGISYKKVLGGIRGYQYGVVDGFLSGSIDGQYLDGLSLTHGQSSRNHVWSFAVGLTNYDSGSPSLCPQRVGGSQPPAFVGNDYFCSSGSPGPGTGRTVYPDPLWSNCDEPKPFCKELAHATTDDLELRICTNEPTYNENVHIDLVEIYVQ